MYTIHLHKLQFHSFHGWHEEESTVGGLFEVDIDIHSSRIVEVNNLEDTIDYTKVYAVTKELMLKPVPLLETLANQIIKAIQKLDDRIEQVTISITKCNPPIPGFTGNVGITIQKKF